jgi:Bacterial Ig domain
MQMKKTIGILLAVCFLMSVTAAAVSARSDFDDHNRMMIKTKAVDDSFKLNSKDNKGNVLKNDKGRDLKVLAAWGAKKGKVSMKRDGTFTYTPFKFRSNEKFIWDSFKYAIKGKDGKISIATVKIFFEIKKNDDHGHNDDGHNNGPGPR